jgi:prolyl-tRNA editing enzyme YbaK/EbsC (Cys-tRNA(Pro) deacylase)
MRGPTKANGYCTGRARYNFAVNTPLSASQDARIADHPSVVRVREALALLGLTDRIVVLPDSARTARAAAEALGCEVAQIANSLVFRLVDSNSPLLVLSSGARRVDTTRLARIAGEPVGKADAAFVREQTGFVIGGVAPVGHVQALRTMIERSLFGFDEIWAAAGHPNTVFRLTPGELARITAGELIDAAEAS